MDIEKYVKEYIKVHNLSMKGADKARLLAKQITIAPSSEVEELEKPFIHFLSSYTPELHRCFENAWECASKLTNVGYVEGIFKIHGTYGSQTVDHAWNSFGSVYFDITPKKRFEARLGLLRVDPRNYISIIEKDHSWVVENQESYNKRASNALGPQLLNET